MSGAYRLFSYDGRRPAISLVDVDRLEHSADEAAVAKRDAEIAQRVGAIITAHYPGVLFRVSVDSPNGVIRLFHPLLPKMWGYTVHIREFNSDPWGKCIMRGCGELLERFNLPRGAYRRDLWQEAKQQHWRTMHGIFPRVYDPMTKKMVTQLPAELRK